MLVLLHFPPWLAVASYATPIPQSGRCFRLAQVEVLGLVLSNPAPPEVVSGTFDATGKIVSRATLVVVAVSLVGQWCAEASNKLSGGLKMYPYHGQNRWETSFGVPLHGVPCTKCLACTVGSANPVQAAHAVKACALTTHQQCSF
jgi:hypothetical protein